MTAPEFSRPIRIDTIGIARPVDSIEANADERAAVARRFDLISVDRLAASCSLVQEAAGIRGVGKIEALVTQACVVSGEPVAARIAAPFALLFVPAGNIAADPDSEMELGEGDLDTIEYDGSAIDLGEAVAETLAVSLDPYPRLPDAELAQWRAKLLSEEEAEAREAEEKAARNPFAVLKGVK